jgi:peptide/nickel transport system ATP-binding protein
MLDSTPPSSSGPFVLCEDVIKIYKTAELEVVALRGLDLAVQRGEFVAIIGTSGSGKSTLLNVLAGVDSPSAGRVRVGDHDLLHMKPRQVVAYRRHQVGLVWQQLERNLVPYLTAWQNIETPLIIAGWSKAERKTRIVELLAATGLAERADHLPSALSGGEQQRLAIAVALAPRPALLLADEPTGELDTLTVLAVFDLLRSLRDRYGTTIIVVTHDLAIASQVDRVVAIRDGRTSTETFRRVESDGPRHEEFAVVDAAGRVQLPAELREQLGIGQRARITVEGDHVAIRPEEARDRRVMAQARSSAGGVSLFRQRGDPVRAVDGVAWISRGCAFRLGGSFWVWKDNPCQSRRLDRPTSGRVEFAGREIGLLAEEELTELRRRDISFVFQSFGLLPLLSAYENVELSLRITDIDRAQRDERVRVALELVGLTNRSSHRPYELSGGEQQRVAIARALVTQPRLIIADEPTGELDSRTAVTVLDLFAQIVRARQITVLIATHDRAIYDHSQIAEIENGRVHTPGALMEAARQTEQAIDRTIFARRR